MIKILITGSNGFIAKSLIELFDKSKYEIIAKTRKELDVTNIDKLRDFFEEHKHVDYVIHTSTSGGRWNDPNTPRIFYENIKMFENLILFKDRYKQMIVFGSGAELAFNFPLSYYGLSKKYITEKIKQQNLNVINLRLWGCFGKYETPDRFIKANILRYKANEPMIIHQDRFMDYFYVNDILPIIEFIFNNNIIFNEINLNYEREYSLKSIANLINGLGGYEVDIKTEKTVGDSSYQGPDHMVIDRNLFNFIGLENGIKQMYNEL